MADRKISDLTALTTPASGDYLPIVDISEAAAASKNKRVTVQSLFQGIPVNVGIGTSSPGKTLEVNGETYITGGIASQGAHIYRDGGTGGAVYSAQTGDTSVISPGATNVRLETNGLERLRIDSSGNVGIGTSSPGASLDVNGGVWARSQFISWSGTTRGGDIETTAAGRLTIRSYNATGADRGEIIFVRNNTGGDFESARIDSSGRVGIGTSSPTTLLDVNADTVRVRTARTPASATATGDAGEICWDANYIYVCTATNTWKRAALSTW